MVFYMKEAILYTRISTDKQAKGKGLKGQLKDAMEACEERGWNIADENVYSDIGSGFHGDQMDGDLGIIVNAVKTGKITKNHIIVLESLDRLGREEPSAALKRFINIIEKTSIYEVSTGMIYGDGGDYPFSVMITIASFIMERAHNESLMKQKRSKRNWAIKVSEADVADYFKVTTSRTPKWIDIVDGRYVLNAEYTKTVREIFKLFINGMGSTGICEHLTERGVDVIVNATSGRYQNKRVEWTISRIDHILTHHAAYGAMKNDKTKEIKEGCYPPAVTKSDFETVAKMRRNRRGKTGGSKEKYTALLSGIAKCGDCGYSYNSFKSNDGTKAKPRMVRRYRCNYRAKKGDCKNNTILATELESAVMNHVKNFEFEPTSKDDKESLLLDIQTAELAVDNLADAFSEDPSNVKIKDSYKKNTNKLKELKRQLEELESSDGISSELKEDFDLEDSATRMLVQSKLSKLLKSAFVISTDKFKGVTLTYVGDSKHEFHNINITHGFDFGTEKHFPLA